MHNLVWLIVAISVGLIFGFLSGGIFSADYSSFWPALGSIGTLGAWYFLYQQSKATTEQLQVFKIATSRAEIHHSIDRIVEYLLDGDKVRFDRLSWINAAMEVDNISTLISMLPERFQVPDTERFGRLLDSKLPEDLFERRDGGSSQLNNQMVEAHKKGKGRYESCNCFAGRKYLLQIFMFTREYEFRNPKDIEGFKFRRATFFHIDSDWNVFKCSYCQNSMKK
ncbi:hypothetical protein KW500_18710 [Vibrio fluvialis]|nr:hypothetical protein [Vibrio fluvialis]